jgi:hypothetical protein
MFSSIEVWLGRLSSVVGQDFIISYEVVLDIDSRLTVDL